MDKGTEQTPHRKRNMNGQLMYKKCSRSLATREMQIKATLRFHFTPVRMTITKNTSNNKMLARMWGKRYIPNDTANWSNHSGKQYGDSSENLEWNHYLTQLSHSLVYTQRT